MEEESQITWIENSSLLMEMITLKTVFSDMQNISFMKSLLKEVVTQERINSNIRFLQILLLKFKNIEIILIPYLQSITQKSSGYMQMQILLLDLRSHRK